jgi:hypothetical protein
MPKSFWIALAIRPSEILIAATAPNLEMAYTNAEKRVPKGTPILTVNLMNNNVDALGQQIKD